MRFHHKAIQPACRPPTATATACRRSRRQPSVFHVLAPVQALLSHSLPSQPARMKAPLALLLAALLLLGAASGAAGDRGDAFPGYSSSPWVPA